MTTTALILGTVFGGVTLLVVAIAMLLRSVGPIGLRTPHTGALAYMEGTPRIPAAAIAAEDAAMLARIMAR